MSVPPRVAIQEWVSRSISFGVKVRFTIGNVHWWMWNGSIILSPKHPDAALSAEVGQPLLTPWLHYHQRILPMFSKRAPLEVQLLDGNP